MVLCWGPGPPQHKTDLSFVDLICVGCTVEHWQFGLFFCSLLDGSGWCETSFPFKSGWSAIFVLEHIWIWIWKILNVNKQDQHKPCVWQTTARVSKPLPFESSSHIDRWNWEWLLFVRGLVECILHNGKSFMPCNTTGPNFGCCNIHMMTASSGPVFVQVLAFQSLRLQSQVVGHLAKLLS